MWFQDGEELFLFGTIIKMKVSELLDRLKLADKNLEVILENGEFVFDLELRKHPHMDNFDDFITIISMDRS
jgi:hypothetical protein